MNGLKHVRRPIRDLVHQLEFRSGTGRPCYLKRNTVHATVIVPILRNGTDGPYSYWRTFQRTTIHEATVLGFIVLGSELMDLPEFAVASTHWSADTGLMGRTISLRGGTA